MAATILASHIALGQENLVLDILHHCQKTTEEGHSPHWAQSTSYIVVARAQHDVLVGFSKTLPSVNVFGGSTDGGALWYWNFSSLGDAKLLFGHLYQMNKVSCWLIGENKVLMEPSEVRLVSFIMPRDWDSRVMHRIWVAETERLRTAAYKSLTEKARVPDKDRRFFVALLYPPGSSTFGSSGQLQYGLKTYTYCFSRETEEAAWNKMAEACKPENKDMHVWIFDLCWRYTKAA